MGQIFPNEQRSKAENSKALSDKIIEAILDDQTDMDALVVAYREKQTSLDEALNILKRLRDSQKVCDISFKAVRSFGATEREFGNFSYD